MIDKGLAKSPTTKIYLATPWFNDVQKERAKKAREYLNQNETVGVIHFPFDFQYKDATVDNDPEGVFGTPEWVAATFQNDCTAVATSDIGVFLYDLDNIDDGCQRCNEPQCHDSDLCSRAQNVSAGFDGNADIFLIICRNF